MQLRCEFMFCIIFGLVILICRNSNPENENLRKDRCGDGNCSCGCIVLFPGYGLSSSPLEPLRDYICQDFPCAKVIIIDISQKCDKLHSIWSELEEAKKFLEPYYKICSNITAIGYSLGGLMARGVIETTSNHNFTTLITVVSANMGISCVPRVYGLSIVAQPLQTMFKFSGCLLMYKEFFQKKMAFAGVMRCCGPGPDENEACYQQYLNLTYLATINNENDHVNKNMYKNNFSLLKTIVSIGIPDDNVVCPPQSSHWATVEKNSIFPMEEQLIYSRDSFGLKTVDQRKKIKMITVNGPAHLTIIYNKTVYQDFIKPYLCNSEN